MPRLKNWQPFEELVDTPPELSTEPSGKKEKRARKPWVQKERESVKKEKVEKVEKAAKPRRLYTRRDKSLNIEAGVFLVCPVCHYYLGVHPNAQLAEAALQEHLATHVRGGRRPRAK